LGGEGARARGRRIGTLLVAPVEYAFAWLEHDQPKEERAEAFRTTVAVLIAIVSIFGALVAWRASTYSTQGEDLDQKATQELVREQQILASINGEVSQDERLLGVYQEHVKLATLLRRQAGLVAKTDAERATLLKADAAEERALTRSLNGFFRAQVPGYPDDAGNVTYDRHSGVSYLEEVDNELPMLHPEQVERQASAKHDKALDLVAIAAVFVLALFFLTLAELTRPRTRVPLTAAGTAALVAGLVLFLVVGP
jgi:cell division protein FtsL